MIPRRYIPHTDIGHSYSVLGRATYTPDVIDRLVREGRIVMTCDDTVTVETPTRYPEGWHLLDEEGLSDSEHSWLIEMRASEPERFANWLSGRFYVSTWPFAPMLGIPKGATRASLDTLTERAIEWIRRGAL